MSRSFRSSLLAVGLALLWLTLLATAPAGSQADPEWRSWNRPVKPFRVIGNIYYVGAAEVSSFLITTPAGHILLDSGFAETVPLIRENLKQLGFKLEDVKILLNSHAHADHAGGLGELQELTGARVMASEADAALLEAGGKGDFHFGDTLAYRPARVDRRLRDGDTVTLGGVTLTARLTPGHTRGCTTWTMQVQEGGKSYNVVLVGSASVPGYRLVGNEKYPNIIGDYEQTFRLLKSLPCDVFLGPHGSFFSLLDKQKRQEQGAAANPFIDPQGYRAYVERTEKAFREIVKKQGG